jgi:hypothetical protein
MPVASWLAGPSAPASKAWSSSLSRTAGRPAKLPVGVC